MAVVLMAATTKKKTARPSKKHFCPLRVFVSWWFIFLANVFLKGWRRGRSPRRQRVLTSLWESNRDGLLDHPHDLAAGRSVGERAARTGVARSHHADPTREVHGDVRAIAHGRQSVHGKFPAPEWSRGVPTQRGRVRIRAIDGDVDEVTRAGAGGADVRHAAERVRTLDEDFDLRVIIHVD